ncbi:MAG: hypothetical protein WCG97_00150 [bacterium]
MPILLYKKLGETPLEAINRLRLERPDLEKAKLSYAGRLDPMAEGLLLVLSGEECSGEQRPHFLDLKKEYEVEILFGVTTDSYDILGLPQDFRINIEKLNVDSVKSQAEKVFKSFIGLEHGLTYPPFSSKTINGKPLFQIALDGKLDTVELPKISGSIDEIEVLGHRNVMTTALLEHVQRVISLVRGDFRQQQILGLWTSLLQNLPSSECWPILKIKVVCQSGVYMRSLAKELGDRLGIGALAFSIKRTKVGEYAMPIKE